MDVNTLRAIVTIISFVVFVGICWWAFSRKRKADFEEAARLPLNDDLPIGGENHE